MVGLEDAVPAARAVVTTRSTLAVVARVDAVVALLPWRLHLSVATGWPLLAAGPAATVLADVQAVVAFLGGRLYHAVSTIGGGNAIRPTAVVRTGVHSVVAKFIGGDDAIATLRCTHRLGFGEVLQRDAEVRAAFIALGLEHGDLVDLAQNQPKLQGRPLRATVGGAVVVAAGGDSHGAAVCSIERERTVFPAVQGAQIHYQGSVDEDPCIVIARKRNLLPTLILEPETCFRREGHVLLAVACRGLLAGRDPAAEPYRVEGRRRGGVEVRVGPGLGVGQGELQNVGHHQVHAIHRRVPLLEVGRGREVAPVGIGNRQVFVQVGGVVAGAARSVAAGTGRPAEVESRRRSCPAPAPGFARRGPRRCRRRFIARAVGKRGRRGRIVGRAAGGDVRRLVGEPAPVRLSVRSQLGLDHGEDRAALAEAVVLVEVDMVARAGGAGVDLMAEPDEVTHHDGDVFGGGWRGHRQVGAGKASFDFASGRASVAAHRVSVVALFVGKPLSVTAGRLAASARTVRLERTVVAAVERHIGLAGAGVITLFRPLFHAVSADGPSTGTRVVTDVARLELAVGVAAVTVDGVSVVARLVADPLLVPAGNSARGPYDGADVARLDLALAAAPIAINGVAVIAGLVAGDLLVTALGDVDARDSLVGAKPSVFDLVASRRAAVAPHGVAVITGLFGLIDDAVAAVGNGRGTAGVAAGRIFSETARPERNRTAGASASSTEQNRTATGARPSS